MGNNLWKNKKLFINLFLILSKNKKKHYKKFIKNIIYLLVFSQIKILQQKCFSKLVFFINKNQ